MCNHFRRKGVGPEPDWAFSQTRIVWKPLPLFAWEEGRIPNEEPGVRDVKISDVAPVITLVDDTLVGMMRKWAWSGRQGPVFNFRSEGRKFGNSQRVLIPAVSFIEYGKPADPKVKLKDQFEFTMKGEDTFFIAGLIQDDAFTMLTVEPGADVAPYHSRQIVVLPRGEAVDWLTLSRPEADILQSSPQGTLEVRPLRLNGELVAA